jgi:hypothetical protein
MHKTIFIIIGFIIAVGITVNIFSESKVSNISNCRVIDLQA